MLKDTGAFFGIISTIRRTGDEGLKDITDMEKDRQYMKMALELAQKRNGIYSTYQW